MLYGDDGNDNGDMGVRDDGVGIDCFWAKETDSVLDSVSDPYSDSDIFP